MITLLWDLDGTLIDSMPVIAGSLNKTLIEYGKPVWSLDKLKPFIGPDIGDTLAELLDLTSVDQIPEAKKNYRRHFTEQMLSSPMFQGIEDQLKHFQSIGAQQFVATAKFQKYAVQIVDALGIRSYFTAVYGSEENGHLGHKVDLLSFIVQEEGLSPAECIMIGDTRFDVEAGLENSMTSVGVCWGYGGVEALKTAGAHFLAERPGDMAEVIRKASACGC